MWCKCWKHFPSYNVFSITLSTYDNIYHVETPNHCTDLFTGFASFVMTTLLHSNIAELTLCLFAIFIGVLGYSHSNTE